MTSEISKFQGISRDFNHKCAVSLSFGAVIYSYCEHSFLIQASVIGAINQETKSFTFYTFNQGIFLSGNMQIIRVQLISWYFVKSKVCCLGHQNIHSFTHSFSLPLTHTHTHTHRSMHPVKCKLLLSLK